MSFTSAWGKSILQKGSSHWTKWRQGLCNLKPKSNQRSVNGPTEGCWPAFGCVFPSSVPGHPEGLQGAWLLCRVHQPWWWAAFCASQNWFRGFDRVQWNLSMWQGVSRAYLLGWELCQRLEGCNEAALSYSGYCRHLVVCIHPSRHAQPLSLDLFLCLPPCKGKVTFCTVVLICPSMYEIRAGVTERNARSTRILEVTPEHDVTHFSSIKNILIRPQPHNLFIFDMLNFWESLVFQWWQSTFLIKWKYVYSQTAKYIVCTFRPQLKRKEEKPYEDSWGNKAFGCKQTLNGKISKAWSHF